MKRKIAVTLAFLLCLSVLTSFAAAVVETKPLTLPIERAEDIVLEDVEIWPEAGLVVITKEVGDVQSVGEYEARVDPDRQVSKMFSFYIYDVNDVLLAICYATVTGTYSQAAGWAQIDSVTAYFVGDYASNFNYTSDKSGAYGYLTIYRYGEAGTFHIFKITTNGVISIV